MADEVRSPESEALAQYKLEAQLPLLPCDQEHPGCRERLLVKKFIIPARYSWEDGWEESWELLDDLHVEVRECFECQQVLVGFPLAFEEYGVGSTWHAAVFDFLTSLSDYYESLLDLEDGLGPPAQEDLAMLRKLLRAKATN